MAVMNYHSVDGLLLGETDGSGNRRDYLTDAVGSITNTVDQSSVLRNSYRYLPYGSFAATATPEPINRFTWTGETGSLSVRGTYAEQYNRARFYGRTTGRWTSVDPLIDYSVRSALLPHVVVHPYSYCRNNPLTWNDPSGLLETPSEQGPISGQGCIQAEFPLKRFVRHPILIALDPKLRVQACATCFSCDCPDECTAGRQIKVSLGLCFSLDPLKVKWSDLFGAGNAAMFDDAVRLITGLLALGAACAAPQKGCPQKGTNAGIEVCGTFCNIGIQLWACAGWKYLSPCRGNSFSDAYFKGGVRYTNCGFLALNLCFQGYVERFD